MCIAIYIVLTGLFIIYSDAILQQYALSISSADGEWMIMAIGWEIIPQIWPVLVMGMVISSAVTLFVVRKTDRQHR